MDFVYNNAMLGSKFDTLATHRSRYCLVVKLLYHSLKMAKNMATTTSFS
jgi:hypothetical protein